MTSICRWYPDRPQKPKKKRSSSFAMLDCCQKVFTHFLLILLHVLVRYCSLSCAQAGPCGLCCWTSSDRGIGNPIGRGSVEAACSTYNFLLTIKGVSVHSVLRLFPLEVRSCFPIYRFFLELSLYNEMATTATWGSICIKLEKDIRTEIRCWVRHLRKANTLNALRQLMAQFQQFDRALLAKIVKRQGSLYKLRSSRKQDELYTPENDVPYGFMVCSLLSSVSKAVFIGCFLFAL